VVPRDQSAADGIRNFLRSSPTEQRFPVVRRPHLVPAHPRVAMKTEQSGRSLAVHIAVIAVGSLLVGGCGGAKTTANVPGALCVDGSAGGGGLASGAGGMAGADGAGGVAGASATGGDAGTGTGGATAGSGGAAGPRGA